MKQQEPSKDYHEVDLNEVSAKSKQLIGRFKMSLLKQFVFIKKNLIFLLILLVLGYVGGLFLDMKPKFYNQEIVVVPNFNSYDYLYAKIAELNARIENSELDYLESIGIEDPKNILEISVKAVSDPYKLVEFKKDNFEMLKLMSENGNLANIVKEDITARHYKFHTISILTKKPIKNHNIINSLLTTLNDDAFFETQKILETQNIQYRLRELDSMNVQASKILDNLGEKAGTQVSKEQVIVMKEGMDVSEIMIIKDNFVKERNTLLLQSKLFDKIIKETIVSQNVRGKEWLFRRGRYILPLILIVLFVVFKRSRKYYQENIHLIS
jgi:hypothetical protein